jgi:hypothetical protein
VILFVASVLGYLLVPAAMLRIVGMDSDPDRKMTSGEAGGSQPLAGDW